MSNLRKLTVWSLVFLMVLILVGCTSDVANNKASTPSKSVSTGAATQEAAVSAAKDTAGQTGQGTIPNTPKLIKTADATIEVGKGEFEKKYEAVKRIAGQFDGHVTNANATREKGVMTSGTVTMRVPAKEFDNAIAAIKKTGTVDSLNIKSDDVSEEYVDLESRLKNYQAQEAQLLAIMAKAQTVDETLKVQEQLTAVQGEIEVIKGRMQYLDNRVDFSTITVTVQEPGAVVPPSDEWGFMDALRTAGKAFLWTINGLIIIIGATLPIIILIALSVLCLRWLIRLRRRKNNPPVSK
ncbi:MAG: DUF4349 domain-containing protein [Actinomycetota bacterium]